MDQHGRRLSSTACAVCQRRPDHGVLRVPCRKRALRASRGQCSVDWIAPARVRVPPAAGHVVGGTIGDLVECRQADQHGSTPSTQVLQLGIPTPSEEAGRQACRSTPPSKCRQHIAVLPVPALRCGLVAGLRKEGRGGLQRTSREPCLSLIRCEQGECSMPINQTAVQVALAVNDSTIREIRANSEARDPKRQQIDTFSVGRTRPLTVPPLVSGTGKRLR